MAFFLLIKSQQRKQENYVTFAEVRKLNNVPRPKQLQSRRQMRRRGSVCWRMWQKKLRQSQEWSGIQIWESTSIFMITLRSHGGTKSECLCVPWFMYFFWQHMTLLRVLSYNFIPNWIEKEYILHVQSSHSFDGIWNLAQLGGYPPCHHTTMHLILRVNVLL